MSVAAAQLALPTPLAEAHAGWPFITVVTAGGSTVRATVAEHLGNLLGAGDRTFRWYVSWGYSEIASIDEEDITWIRGWHEKDSPEVRAMLVLRGLT